MNRTLEEMMYISEGHNPWGTGNGLGYIPTKYNIKGAGYLVSINKKRMAGGTLPKGTYTRVKNDLEEQMNNLINQDEYDKDDLASLYSIYIELKKQKEDENMHLNYSNDDEISGYLDKQDDKVVKINQELIDDEEEIKKINSTIKNMKQEIKNIKTSEEDLERKTESFKDKKLKGNKNENDENDFFNSDEFKEQMKWYEENYDNLDEDELFVYIQSLAKLKEIENKDKGSSNEITELDKNLYKAVKDFEILTGKESEYHYEDKEDYEKSLDKWYIKEIKPEKFDNEFINKLNILGYSNAAIGDLCEIFYGSKKELFEFINNNKDTSTVFNTSTTLDNQCYTKKMKIIGENEVIIKGKKKKKADFYLVDFVSDKNLYEMKALEKTFDDFYKKGSIHLVGTKVSENVNFVGNFIYDKNDNKVVVKNIGYRDYYNKPVKFNTLEGNNFNYNVIYCLKDGIYNCNLSNPNLWNIDKNNKAIFKFLPDFYGNVNIPIKYIQRVDNSLVKQINK